MKNSDGSPFDTFIFSIGRNTAFEVPPLQDMDLLVYKRVGTSLDFLYSS